MPKIFKKQGMFGFSKSRITRWKKEVELDKVVPAKEYKQVHPMALNEKEFLAMVLQGPIHAITSKNTKKVLERVAPMKFGISISQKSN